MSDTTEIVLGPDSAQDPYNTKAAEASQWRGHRVAAMVLRVVVFLCPLSVAAFLGLVVSRSMPGATFGIDITRLVITTVTSVAAFIVVERLARRFLPLAVLLRLNLVFPDHAPSRFSVALRSTSVRKLEQWVHEARASENVALLAGKVVTLASALNTHDRRTRGHCERTRALADLIVEELHLSPAEANKIRWGAFLHDIGKLVVPAEILNKPGKPTTREWEVLKSHPEAGARLVEPLRPFLGSGVDAVGSHHENYDGSGYPAGLSGEQLPLAARIVSVADAFEVMTAVRAYKRPMTLQTARAELARRSGTQFDPHVVRAFLNVSLGRVHWTLGFAAWLAELPFLSFLPRVAAQVSATAGVGVAPIALPTVAAASLGAMAVMGHVHPSTTRQTSSAAHVPAPASVRRAMPTAEPKAGSAPTVVGTGQSPTPTEPGLTAAPSQIVHVVDNPIASGALDDTGVPSAVTTTVHGLDTNPLENAGDTVTIQAVGHRPGGTAIPETTAATTSATTARADVGVLGDAIAVSDALLDGDRPTTSR
jgi:hypothetical protein